MAGERLATVRLRLGEASEALLAKVRALLCPPSPLTPFGRRYLDVLQRRPEVVVAHGALVAALGSSGADALGA